MWSGRQAAVGKVWASHHGASPRSVRTLLTSSLHQRQRGTSPVGHRQNPASGSVTHASRIGPDGGASGSGREVPAGPTTRALKLARKVPIPPAPVVMLRKHIDLFGTAPDGRLFRSENGNPIQPSTWWQVWQKVRKASLSEEELASPLMRRPYDLRHSGVTWRLNSGVPATREAAWARHSVEVLMHVYARCVTGLEDTGEFRRHARSGDDSRGYEVAPPVGFEPTLPAPEGADQKASDLRNHPKGQAFGRVMGAKPPARGAQIKGALRASREGYPRQASADDDAGKCSGGDLP